MTRREVKSSRDGSRGVRPDWTHSISCLPKLRRIRPPMSRHVKHLLIEEKGVLGTGSTPGFLCGNQRLACGGRRHII
jgi:hypothetical protein